MSASRNKIVINTVYGFVLLPNHITFKRFEKNSSPFYIEGKQETEGIGVILSAVLDSRDEVAIVPEPNSKYFNSRHVYIYGNSHHHTDYQLKTILYTNDFFQPIKQLSFTESDLIVSSQKKVIIYGYIDDNPKKDQKYYLDMYRETSHNKNLRYLETYCEVS